MGKKEEKILVLSIFILLLLPGILALSAPEELQKGINTAAYHAAQYHVGNENYAEYTSNMNKVEEEINAALISSNEKDLSKENLEKVLGQANENVEWVSQGKDQEVKLDTPVVAWSDKVIFDGKEQVDYNLLPTLNDKNKVGYKIDFSTKFVQSKPIIDIKNEISKIETLAKTYQLSSETNKIQNANILAETTVNVEKLFKDYMALSTHENCEDTMSEILGEETKTSQIAVIVKEVKIAQNKNIDAIARIETGEGGKGQEDNNFVNLKMNLEQDGKTVGYPLETLSLKPFENLDSSGFKRAIIDSNQILQQMIKVENYAAAYNAMKRIETLNDLWNKKYSNSEKKVKLENFVDQNQFMHSLFEGSTRKTSYTEQTLFEKTLVQEFQDNGEEICTNQIDDNNDSLIDCADNLCSGKVCGTTKINITTGNETSEELKEMYCVLGTCQIVEEPNKTKAPVCGNNLCESNESETCPTDCNKCPVFQPIECSGDVISQGIDSNNCSLEPYCIKKKDSCTTNQDCAQPLCGTSECIEGICKTTNLSTCQERVCTEDEQKFQECDSGKSIVIEKCSNGIWVSTGLKCDVAISGPTQPIELLTGKGCIIAEDCGNKNDVCIKGVCEALAMKKEIIPQNEAGSAAKGVSGISFTGDVVGITATGITGIIPNPTEPNVLAKPNDYKRITKTTGTTSSFITGVSRTDKPEEIIPTQTNTAGTNTEVSTRNLIDISSKEKNVFVVSGLCIKDQKGETPVLAFGGGGQDFNLISDLQKTYETDGTESYCKWKLENLLRERKELEKSFNQEFVRKFFEEDLPNYADEWENAPQTIMDLHSQNIKNQIETAKMMECLGIKELSEYNLININYENPLYGTLKYSEKISSAKFPGMVNEVQIISPSIDEFTVFPSDTFVKNDLKINMKNNAFPGSIKNSAERKANNGLTSTEKDSVRANEKLMQMIRDLVKNSPDGNYNIQAKVVDSSGEVVYNFYARINENEIIKAQPLVPETTPNKNAEITIGFEELYQILKDSQKREYKQNSPWEKPSLSPLGVLASTLDWANTQIKLRNLMNSIQVSPDKESSQLKPLFKELFFTVAGGKDATTSIATANEQQTIWNNKGMAINIAA